MFFLDLCFVAKIFHQISTRRTSPFHEPCPHEEPLVKKIITKNIILRSRSHVKIISRQGVSFARNEGFARGVHLWVLNKERRWEREENNNARSSHYWPDTSGCGTCPRLSSVIPISGRKSDDGRATQLSAALFFFYFLECLLPLAEATLFLTIIISYRCFCYNCSLGETVRFYSGGGIARGIPEYWIRKGGGNVERIIKLVKAFADLIRAIAELIRVFKA